MKKIILTTVVVSIMLNFLIISVSAINLIMTVISDFNFSYNGRNREFDSPMVVINDYSYVPLREFSEMLGYKVNWNEKERKIELTQKNQFIFMPFETNMLGIQLGMSMEELIKIKGEPMKRDLIYSEAVSIYDYRFYYDFGEISLLSYDNINYFVGGFSIISNEYWGPRSTRI